MLRFLALGFLALGFCGRSASPSDSFAYSQTEQTVGCSAKVATPNGCLEWPHSSTGLCCAVLNSSDTHRLCLSGIAIYSLVCGAG